MTTLDVAMKSIENSIVGHKLLRWWWRHTDWWRWWLLQFWNNTNNLELSSSLSCLLHSQSLMVLLLLCYVHHQLGQILSFTALDDTQIYGACWHSIYWLYYIGLWLGENALWWSVWIVFGSCCNASYSSNWIFLRLSKH